MLESSEEMFQRYVDGCRRAEGGANQWNKLEKRGMERASDWVSTKVQMCV